MYSVPRSLKPAGRPSSKPQTDGKSPPSRAYISPRLLLATRQLAAGRHAAQAFAFQPPGRCLDHSAGQLRRVVQGLTAEGAMQQRTPSLGERMVRALMAPSSHGLMTIEVSSDSKAVHALSAQKGPMQLVSQSSLAPDQGGAVYQGFHATVLLASVMHKGRPVGLLLDGNDLQSNPVMQALKAWQARSNDSRALHQLTAADFQAFNQAHPDMDLHQAAFRVVDLGDLLAASHARTVAVQRLSFEESNPFVSVNHHETTTLNGVPYTEPVAPLVSQDAGRALQAALEAEPGQIERFPLK